MREIKFKAWDKNHNKWYETVQVGTNCCHSVYDYEREQWLEFDEFCGDVVQYTGLKDKNGKEIYEGDIIQCPKYYEIPEYGYNPLEVAGHVIFEEGSWRLSEGGCLYDEYESYDGDFEIIGNIYEGDKS